MINAYFCLFYFEFSAVFLILSYPRGQCKDAPFSHMVRGSQSVRIAEKIEKNCEFYVKFSWFSSSVLKDFLFFVKTAPIFSDKFGVLFVE